MEVRSAEGLALKTVSSATTFTQLDLGTLGGQRSYASAISDRDVVIGWSETAEGATHAFRWSAAEGMIDLGTLPGDPYSRAVAILEGGVLGGDEILGMSGDQFDWTPVVWSGSGAMAPLPIPPLPGAESGYLGAFNARGDVVGMDYVGYGHAWIWSAKWGKYDLTANAPGGSNEGTANAVASSGLAMLSTRSPECENPFSATCWRTYLWTRQGGYLPLGTPEDERNVDVVGLGLGTGGTVVGWRRNRSSHSPFRWDPGTGFTLLPVYDEGSFDQGYATAVNASGTVVGVDRSGDSGGAVVWPAGGGVVRLSADEPGGIAVAINAKGTIAGWTAMPDGSTHAVIWIPRFGAPVEEPVSSLALRTPTLGGTAPCLRELQTIVSMQALFACIQDADRGYQGDLQGPERP